MSPDDARREVIQLTGAVLDDDAHDIALGTGWHMKTREEGGRLLTRFDFIIAAEVA